MNKVQQRIASDALELYDDVTETLRFINTAESDVNVDVPRLTLPDVTRYVALILLLKVYFVTKCGFGVSCTNIFQIVKEFFKHSYAQTYKIYTWINLKLSFKILLMENDDDER